MPYTNKVEVDIQNLYIFRDMLVKHLYDMKDRPQAEIIEEVYSKLTTMIDTLKDK